MKTLFRLACTALCLLSFTLATQAQIISTVAGNGTSGFSGMGGPATAASTGYPTRVAVDTNGNLFFGDFTNEYIYKVDAATGNISIYAGTGSSGFGGDNAPATAAQVHGVQGLATDKTGNLYIADVYNNRIRKIDLAGVITTVAGGGPGPFSGDGGQATAAGLFQPFGVAVDTAGSIYIADNYNNRIRKVDPTGIISTIAGNGTAGNMGDGGPATAAELSAPVDLCVDKHGNVLISEITNYIRKVSPSGIITTFAGTGGTGGFSGDGGPATAAVFNNLEGIATDKMGNVYIMDALNNRLRIIDTGGTINTFAGNGVAGYSGDGMPATAAELNVSNGVTTDKWGNVYIADNNNYRVREISSIDSFYVDTSTSSTTGVLACVSGPSVRMYPNPVYDELNLKITSLYDEAAIVRIVNAKGETVKLQHAATNKELVINSGLAPGLYVVNVTAGHGSWAGHITVLDKRR